MRISSNIHPQKKTNVNKNTVIPVAVISRKGLESSDRVEVVFSEPIQAVCVARSCPDLDHQKQARHVDPALACTLPASCQH